MLEVSDAARSALAGILARADASTGVTLRIAPTSEGLVELVPSMPRPGDLSFDHGDTTVLVVDSALARRLGNRRVDVEGSDDRLKITLTASGPRPGH